jgi:hypothetical protein
MIKESVLLDTVYIPGTKNLKNRPIVVNQTHLYYCTLLNTETMVHNAVVLSTTTLSVTFIIIMHMVNVVKLNLIMQCCYAECQRSESCSTRFRIVTNIFTLFCKLDHFNIGHYFLRYTQMV